MFIELRQISPNGSLTALDRGQFSMSVLVIYHSSRIVASHLAKITCPRSQFYGHVNWICGH